MARLEVISIDQAYCRNLLEQLKQYASVPDDSRDALLDDLLVTAVQRVQEYADKALAVTTVRLTATVPASGVVRLYMGGGDVTDCRTDTGDEAAFDLLPGGRLRPLLRPGRTIQVTYTTIPNAGDRHALLPVVLRYATALYDGEEGDALNKILPEAV